jgi:hypothetical protein
VCVKYETGAWKYDDNYSYYSFTPAESDVLVALVNFTDDTVTALAGQNGMENGINWTFNSFDYRPDARGAGIARYTWMETNMSTWISQASR